MLTRPRIHPATLRPSTGTIRRIGLLSTYPPQVCGLATFAAALAGQWRVSQNRVDVIRIDDGTRPDAAAPTNQGPKNQGPKNQESSNGGVLVNGSQRSLRDATAALSRCDVAMIQHEYGIYGGPDGDEVVTLMEGLTVPSVVTLHTVPLQPTARQRMLLEQIVALAHRAVVMSTTARDRLSSLYAIDPSKVAVIPHGASAPSLASVDEGQSASPTPELLTWGLLGPGKGVEHVIEALALLAHVGVRPNYTVAGVTHPKVLAQFGDAYRESLIRRCIELGISDQVTFDDTYRTVPQLMQFVASSSVVVLPYDSRDQVTSGVLVDAIAAGRPVIATAFPHAMELLCSGAGIVVPHGDRVALAEAIRSVVTDQDVAANMAAHAARLSPSLAWSTIADQYCGLSDEIIASQSSVAI
jgi:glycosyltransferase involved in cell wall biosynthesis